MILARRRLLQILSFAGCAAALPGCATAPPAQYYRLAPVPGTAVPGTAVPGTAVQSPRASVKIRDIGIPAYLDQSGIAEPSGQYQFAASANDLWAEPLAGMLQSVLVQNLTQRLPQMTVTASSGAVGTPADLLVEIDVQRFDPDASGVVVLSAQLGVKAAKDNRFLATRTLQTSLTPAAPGMAGMMAAMSTLWAGLADSVAQVVAQNAGSVAAGN